MERSVASGLELLREADYSIRMASVPPSRRSVSFPSLFVFRSVRPSRYPVTPSAGFTLIELLVVIGIIALLAALIFPAIRDAIRSGRQTTSLGNLKQWAG